MGLRRMILGREKITREIEDRMAYCLPFEYEGRLFVPERTCHDVSEPPTSGFWPTPHFECSRCGKHHVSTEYVYYCPNCGAKVVE